MLDENLESAGDGTSAHDAKAGCPRDVPRPRLPSFRVNGTVPITIGFYKKDTVVIQSRPARSYL